jgi:hypothetical protein
MGVDPKTSHRIDKAAGGARLASDRPRVNVAFLPGELGPYERARQLHRRFAIKLARSPGGQRDGRHLALKRWRRDFRAGL